MTGTVQQFVSEADFQKAVIELAQWRKWRVVHFRPALTKSGHYVTPIQGDAGFVDLVLARCGRVLHVELKSMHGRMDDEQKAWRDNIGDSWRMWRPSDWPEIERELA